MFPLLSMQNGAAVYCFFGTYALQIWIPNMKNWSCSPFDMSCWKIQLLSCLLPTRISFTWEASVFFVCFESQSGRWLPHNLSGWDYRQIVAGSVMGRGIYSILQVSPTVQHCSKHPAGRYTITWYFVLAKVKSTDHIPPISCWSNIFKTRFGIKHSAGCFAKRRNRFPPRQQTKV